MLLPLILSAGPDNHVITTEKVDKTMSEAEISSNVYLPVELVAVHALPEL